jgi:hypothetical protein
MTPTVPRFPAGAHDGDHFSHFRSLGMPDAGCGTRFGDHMAPNHMPSEELRLV